MTRCTTTTSLNQWRPQTIRGGKEITVTQPRLKVVVAIQTFDLARDFLARSDAMRTQPEDHRPFQRAPPQDHHSSGFVTQLSIADEALETQGENDTCSQVAAVKRQCKNLSKSENMLDIVAKKNQ
ncbi:uncharacterized protein LOC143030676 isoform X1 [Oratosquilla oratoria]|uniref:uncharacterized protein LOC143030676 isoform X1 n=1 Tax=Oratosquilla oratoria TaxID=337810 RepID=UPI003F76493A